MLQLAVFASLLSLCYSICPSGFDLVRNGECYRELVEADYANGHSAPDQAKKACARYNSLPIVIKNQEDNDYWLGVAIENHKKDSNDGYIFLGKSYLSLSPGSMFSAGLECNRNYHWQWMDGSKITFKPDGVDTGIMGECDNTDDPWAWKCMWYMDPKTNNWDKICNSNHHVDLYCVITPTPNDDEPDPVCDNFTHDDDDDICYQTAANYTEANTICHSFGASVPSIHNDRANNFVRRLAVSKGMVTPLMLGGRLDGKNAITWEDGSKDDYRNFANGFPQNGNGECIALQTDNINGQWMNVDCDTNHPFACVRATNAQTPSCDGALHSEGDIIYSPGFPSSASESCDYLLKVNTGMLVEVEILFLEANSCCDRLELFEGSLGGKSIANLTGEHYNGYKFRTTTQNVMRASWEPNGGVNVRGMMITFRGVPK